MRTMMLNAQFVEAVGMTMEEITDIDSTPSISIR